MNLRVARTNLPSTPHSYPGCRALHLETVRLVINFLFISFMSHLVLVCVVSAPGQAADRIVSGTGRDGVFLVLAASDRLRVAVAGVATGALEMRVAP
jgi:hypothetical protein